MKGYLAQFMRWVTPYEQDQQEFETTPLAGGTSSGVHESQSSVGKLRGT